MSDLLQGFGINEADAFSGGYILFRPRTAPIRWSSSTAMVAQVVGQCRSPWLPWSMRRSRRPTSSPSEPSSAAAARGHRRRGDFTVSECRLVRRHRAAGRRRSSRVTRCIPRELQVDLRATAAGVDHGQLAADRIHQRAHDHQAHAGGLVRARDHQRAVIVGGGAPGCRCRAWDRGRCRGSTGPTGHPRRTRPPG